jgi:VanZ family protein
MKYNIFFVVLYIVAVILATTLPVPKTDITRYDKVIHFAMFFILTLLLLTLSFPKYKKFFVGFIAVDLAAITEIVQIAIPYRSFSWFDIIADIIGIVSGLFLGFLLKEQI